MHAANFTRFYIVAHSREMDLTHVLPTKCEMKALFRISDPVQGPQQPHNDIVKYLKSLDLRTARIDRRPSLNSEPFSSVYFAEVHGSEEQNADEMLASWTVDVEKAAKRVKREGGEAEVIGIW
jgi:prephenate dehydratase